MFDPEDEDEDEDDDEEYEEIGSVGIPEDVPLGARFRGRVTKSLLKPKRNWLKSVIKPVKKVRKSYSDRRKF